jgi:ribosome biogenesis GTPase A
MATEKDLKIIAAVMRISPAVNTTKSIAKGLLNNLLQTYSHPEQGMSKSLNYKENRQDTSMTNELEIDIALSCLDACKYGLVWIIFLCIYSSM